MSSRCINALQSFLQKDLFGSNLQCKR